MHAAYLLDLRTHFRQALRMTEKIVNEPKSRGHGVAHRGPEHRQLKRGAQGSFIEVIEVLEALLHELAVVGSTVLHHRVVQDLAGFVGYTGV